MQKTVRPVLILLAALMALVMPHAAFARDDIAPPPAAAPLAPVKTEPLDDGDSSPVLTGAAKVRGSLIEVNGTRVRLAGAAVPSSGQAMSSVAGDLLNTLIEGADVRCQVLGLDRDGQRLARCSSKYSNDIAEAMIRAGYAEYRRLPALSLELRAAYNEAETLAREEKIGLWKPGTTRTASTVTGEPPPARTPRVSDLLAENTETPAAPPEDMAADEEPTTSKPANENGDTASADATTADEPKPEDEKPVEAARPRRSTEPKPTATEAKPQPTKPVEPATEKPAPAPAPVVTPVPVVVQAPAAPEQPDTANWMIALAGFMIALALPLSTWLGIWGRRRQHAAGQAAMDRRSSMEKVDRAQAYAIALQAEINALTLSLSTRADMARVAAQQPLEEVRRSLPSLMTRVPALCLEWSEAGLIGRRAAFTLRQLAVRLTEISERLNVLDANAKNGTDRPAQRGDELQSLAAEFDGAAQDARLVKELLQEFWTKPGNKRAR